MDKGRVISSEENTLCRVIVCDLKDAVNHLPEILLELGFKIEEVQLALVKPNICGIYLPSLDLLSSIVELLLSKAKSVVIGETRTMVCKPNKQFEKFGIVSMLKRFDGRVRTLDIRIVLVVEVPVPHPHAIKKVSLLKKGLGI